MSCMRYVGALAALLLSSGVVSGQQAAGESATAGGSLRRALAEGEDLLAALKGTKGEERQAGLQRLADFYQGSLERHAGDRPSCARLNFELGETWRKHGSVERALAAYQKSAELDAERYATRAGLQIAHAQRRLERFDEALATYRRIAQATPESAAVREAREWIGRCLEAKGDVDGAIVAYRDLLQQASGPRETLDVANRLANALIDKGDLAGAEEVLRRADSAVPSSGEDVARWRKAADSMSARRALQRARDKRDGVHEDARKLEAARKR